ncbi:MAG: hypothetical protein ACLT4Y_09035 [Bifidobacterium breve]
MRAGPDGPVGLRLISDAREGGGWLLDASGDAHAAQEPVNRA